MPEFLKRDEWVKRLERGDNMEEICIRKYGGCEVVAKEVDPVTGMTDVTFVVSTADLDRDDDIIDPEGWELENYQKNPVVLWAHDYRNVPVAKSLRTWVEDGKLLSTDRFTPQEVNPFGHMVYQMVKGGFLTATSVGFRPLTYVFNDEHKGYDFQTQEKLEHSVVPVPSNPEALVAASAAGIDMHPMKEWCESYLDLDSDGKKVALWLPKEIIETVHASLSSVAVSLTDTSTGDGIVTGDTITEGGTAKQTPSTPTVEDLNINTEPSEEIMEEAIKALTEVVKELRAAVDGLDDKIKAAVSAAIAEKVPTPPEPDPKAKAEEDGEDMDAEDVAAIAKAATEAVLTATTGQLPE